MRTVHLAAGAGFVPAPSDVAWFATVVVLSGPTPGLGTTRPSGRRLTGGWAFLDALLLAGVMGRAGGGEPRRRVAGG